MRRDLPGALVIAGGTFVWKCHIEATATGDEDPLQEYDESKLGPFDLFPCNKRKVDVDAFVIASHGGPTLLRILTEFKQGNSADLFRIPNLAIPDSDGVFQLTPQIDEKIDWDTNITRWDLVDRLPIAASIRTSIGCPYQCEFCDFYKVFGGVTLRSSSSLLKEIDLLKNTSLSRQENPLVLELADDNAFINTKRASDICEIIKKSKIGIPWRSFLRADRVNDSNIGLIKDSGIFIANIGLESGDEKQLERMNKRLDLAATKTSIELLDRNGIHCQFYLVLGFPGESEKTLANTAAYLNSLDTTLSAWMAFPLIIAPLSGVASAESRARWSLKGNGSTWEHATMISGELKEHAARFLSSVTEVPYEHTEEHLFWYCYFLKPDQRRNAHRLRHTAAVAVMDKKPWETVSSAFSGLAKAFGIRTAAPPESFRQHLHWSA